MKTMFTAETSPQGRRSGTIHTPNTMPSVTAGNSLEQGGTNLPNGPLDRIKIGLGIALLAGLTGCVGYVDGGYYGDYYGGPAMVSGPDMYFYGGGYERGHDVRAYSHRGGESRAVAHSSVSHGGGHSSGGGHGGKH